MKNKLKTESDLSLGFCVSCSTWNICYTGSITNYSMHKKDNFTWTEKVGKIFHFDQKRNCILLLLQDINFKKLFEVECNPSIVVFGTILLYKVFIQLLIMDCLLLNLNWIINEF